MISCCRTYIIPALFRDSTRSAPTSVGARQSVQGATRTRSVQPGRHLAQSTTRVGLPRPPRGHTRRVEGQSDAFPGTHFGGCVVRRFGSIAVRKDSPGVPSSLGPRANRANPANCAPGPCGGAGTGNLRGRVSFSTVSGRSRAPFRGCPRLAQPAGAACRPLSSRTWRMRSRTGQTARATARG